MVSVCFSVGLSRPAAKQLIVFNQTLTALWGYFETQGIPNKLIYCLADVYSNMAIKTSSKERKQAGNAKLVRYFDLLADRLMRVKCRATSVAKK